jgi:hypothetical protein
VIVLVIVLVLDLQPSFRPPVSGWWVRIRIAEILRLTPFDRSPSAKSSLEDLKKKMTPEQIAEAQKRASNFKPR